MQAFYQHVGEIGSERDFPKSLFGEGGQVRRFQLPDISKYLPLTTVEKRELAAECGKASPFGFQIWGVPAGAQAVMRQVQVGDVFLLLRTVGPEGRFGYAGRVIGIPRCDGRALSEKLWGEARFPLIIFLEGGASILPWPEFCASVGYGARLNPRGQTARIHPDKLSASAYRDANGLLGAALSRTGPSEPSDSDLKASDDRVEDADLASLSSPEGRKIMRMHLQRERDPHLTKRFKASLKSWACCVCSFDFEEAYGLIGRGYIEAHHTRPIAGMAEGDETDIRSLVGVCSNCHRMLHRVAPPLRVEELREALEEGKQE
ncbi:hypothetical protein ACE7GA_17230 [Roseomonas sp. CCTCC AB2023176]|uniref:HNH endonuclease n=1 Tax=Roseomonas sp. CCTCC AB2023176 TaxID=3342640 RepID=UPI0035E1593C